MVQGTWYDMEVTTGLTCQVSSAASLFASASYQAGLDGDSEAWGGKIGLKFSW